MTPPALERIFEVDGPLDLLATLRPLLRGHGDPTMRLARAAVVRATRTSSGPATLEVRQETGRLLARAWGPGAEVALDGVPALVGLADRPWEFRPAEPRLAALARRLPGLRIGRTGAVFEALLPAILEQKVTGEEARTAFRGIVRTWGEPAPGPGRLLVPPDPAVLARIPYFEFHGFGLERRRAEILRRAAAAAPALEAAAGMAPDAAHRRLRAVPGIGPWTAAEVGARAFGDPDAVSVGDFHLPNVVAWALAGEPRGTDERMLELLEPYRGQRGRVIRLLEASGIVPPRRGPRLAPRAFAGC